MKKMKIQGWPESITTGRDTLLDAAIAAGVPFDHQCRSGECGRCRCLLLSGVVAELPAQPGVLETADHRQGWRLACRSIAKTDVTIELPYKLPAPRPRRQQLAGQVLSRHSVTSDVSQLTIEPERPLEFHAGQYVELKFNGLPARSYSPSNPPGTSLLNFLVRTIPGGAVSTHVATVVKPGDRCQIEGPYGSACLSGASDAPLLLAGGGTGLAPMLSILGKLSAHAPDAQCDLYIGVRRPQDMLASAELVRAAKTMSRLRIVPVYSEKAPDGAQQGFLAPVIGDMHHCLEEHEVFIAGPPPMVESVEHEVIRLGARQEQVHADPFVAQHAKSGPKRFLSLERIRSVIGI